MGFRYPIKKQTIGANGINGPMVEPERLRFVLVVFSGGPVQLSWVDADGRSSTWEVDVAINLISTWEPPVKITGNGAVVQGAWMDPSDFLDPNSLLIGNSVTTDIGSAGTYAKDATLGAISAQLPGTLGAMGGLKVEIVNPLVITSHGPSVNVHDQGA